MVNSKRNKSNPIVLKRGMTIGTGNAETDDEFLFSCFYNHEAKDELLRTTSPKMIISGRTGSGKTAILRVIERDLNNTAVLELENMSMSYIANSDVLRFLDELGADLDLLFQVLWKHVLCIEFIRLRWSVNNAQKSRSIFERMSEFLFQDERKKKALNYLETWQDRFWITMDDNIKEITEHYDKELSAALSGELEKFKAGGQYVKRLSEDKKREIISRTKDIIDGSQLSQLANVIDALAYVSERDKIGVYYLLVDQLDENWVDSRIRFKLIRALLNSLRQFRKIADLKIVIALRTDVRERAMLEASDPTFQREKLDDYALDLTWTKQQLRDLIDSRISELFRRRYSKEAVGFSDLFPEKIGARATIDWMLERTLMRPRDIIRFINQVLMEASGATAISQAHVTKGFLKYSSERRDALFQEWVSTFPYLKEMLEVFIFGSRRSVYLHEIEDNKLDPLLLKIITAPDDGSALYQMVKSYMEGNSTKKEAILAECASITYRAGCVGLKLSNDHPFIYSHLNEPLVSSAIITPSTRIRIQPMLYGAYRIEEIN